MGSSRGLVAKRREKILKSLIENKVVYTEQLAKELNVSEMTIRRDLQQFEDQKLVERFYGGAKLIEDSLKTEQINNNVPIDNSSKKIRIAKAAANLVKENDVVFINSGSTAFLIINHLLERNVTILTNNGRVINSEFSNTKANLIVSGGEIYERKKSLVGDFSINSFTLVTADICFLGVGGITANKITTYALPETAVNRTILERTNGPRVVVAEGKKVGFTNNFVTAETWMITHLITDQSADPQEIEKIRKQGIEVIFVDE